MIERRFAAGETIFREGGPTDSVFRVTQGRVRLVAGDGSKSEFGKGELFGDIGILRAAPRAATAKAMESTTVLVVDRNSLIDALDSGASVVVDALRTLFQGNGTGQVAGAEGAAETSVAESMVCNGAADKANAVVVELSGLTRTLTRQLPRNGVTITERPFHVGRRTDETGEAEAAGTELTLTDHEPFNLSRDHFVIEDTPDGIVVRDRGSRLGTYVNGRRIGGSTAASAAMLVAGENEIIAGSRKSPIRFRAVVRSPAEAARLP